VRGQFEEDVEQCNSCRVHFSGRKKKANCRHCGRIFCPDCLSKQVLEFVTDDTLVTVGIFSDCYLLPKCPFLNLEILEKYEASFAAMLDFRFLT
jgi:hypothetical protein